MSALRYGEPWIYEISGSKLFYAMFVEALGLKDERDALRAEIEAMKKQEPVAWLHGSRPESDVVTDAVKHVWGRVAVGYLAEYSIPLVIKPTAQGEVK